jgi:hypothetical protein
MGGAAHRNRSRSSQAVAIMFNPDTAPGGGSYFLPTFEAAARSLKVEPITAPVHSDAEIEMFINSFGREPEGGLVVTEDALMFVHRALIILQAARNNMLRSISHRSSLMPAVCFPTDRRSGQFSSHGILCGSHSPWRKAGRFAGSTAGLI